MVYWLHKAASLFLPIAVTYADCLHRVPPVLLIARAVL